jgi:hypothetical protein
MTMAFDLAAGTYVLLIRSTNAGSTIGICVAVNGRSTAGLRASQGSGGIGGRLRRVTTTLPEA